MMLLRSVALLAALSSCATAFVVPGNSRPQDVSLCATAKDIESIRKKEFVALMASELGYSKTEAEAALLCTLEIISGVSLVCAMSVCLFDSFFMIPCLLPFVVMDAQSSTAIATIRKRPMASNVQLATLLTHQYI